MMIPLRATNIQIQSALTKMMRRDQLIPIQPQASQLGFRPRSQDEIKTETTNEQCKISVYKNRLL